MRTLSLPQRRLPSNCGAVLFGAIRSVVGAVTRGEIDDAYQAIRNTLSDQSVFGPG
jgi:hypothetical protein